MMRAAISKHGKNSDGTTEVKLIPKSGGDEGKNGIKSITISPAISTTPSLDSQFPIYWEDLTEEQKSDGITINCTHDTFTEGEYTITVEPTEEWYAGVIGWDSTPTIGETAGESVTASTSPFPAGQFSVIGLRTQSNDGDQVLVNINLGSD